MRCSRFDRRILDECESNPEVLDQVSFWKAAVRSTGVTFCNLPFAYCCKFDEPGVEDAVIVHYMASRKFRENNRG